MTATGQLIKVAVFGPAPAKVIAVPLVYIRPLIDTGAADVIAPVPAIIFPLKVGGMLVISVTVVATLETQKIFPAQAPFSRLILADVNVILPAAAVTKNWAAGLPPASKLSTQLVS